MSISQSTTETLPAKGVDAHDSVDIVRKAAALKKAGYGFIGQYLGTDASQTGNGEFLTPTEANTFVNAGLQIVSIFQKPQMSDTVFDTGAHTYAWQDYLTEAQGEADAASAYKAAEAVHQTFGSAIYFAMDFDPGSTSGISEATALARVHNYFSGVEAYLSGRPADKTFAIGVYGAGDTLTAASRGGLAHYTWLSESTGWSGYDTWKPSAAGTLRSSILQIESKTFGGVPIDTDRTSARPFGAWGDDILKGGTGQDRLSGGAGDDILAGHLGKDTLTGGAGDDTFVFDSKLGSGNVDTIVDFQPGHDSILLDSHVFAKIGASLSASEFYVGSAARDKNDHIIYNSKTGALSYDADGMCGHAAVEFAVVKDHAKLTYHDFHVGHLTG